MVEIRCCYCFFDKCCISSYRKETFGQLVERIDKLLGSHYEKEERKGLCSGSIRPTRFCIGNSWILKTRDSLLNEKRYIVCRDHIERIIDNIVLSVCQEVYANKQCLISDKYFDQYRIKKKPSCFYFYMEDLIALSEFSAE